MALKIYKADGTEITIGSTVKASTVAFNPPAVVTPSAVVPVVPTPAPKQRGHRRQIPLARYQKLFSYIERGETLSDACKRPKMPALRTTWDRIKSDAEVAKLYKQAIEMSIESDLDMCVKLADSVLDGYAPSMIKPGDRVAARKLAISTRLEMARMRMADKYSPAAAASVHNNMVVVVNSPDLIDDEPEPVEVVDPLLESGAGDD